jgi:hypothetical protein
MTRIAAVASVSAVLALVTFTDAAAKMVRADTRPAATPYLQLVGTIPVAGQATVRSGDTATAYGSGFCGSPTCSPVTIMVATRIAAKDIQVSANGTFRATFAVSEDPGQYTVSASQKAADGSTLTDFATLVVAIGDEEERTPVPGVTLRLVNAQDGVFFTAVRAAHSYAGKVAFLQRLSQTQRWKSIKRVKLGPNATKRFTVSLPHGKSKLRMLVPRTRRDARPMISRILVIRR